MLIRFARRRRTCEEIERRREEQTAGMGRVLGICGLIFLAFETLAGTMLVLPAWLEVQSLRQQRESVNQRLSKAQEEEGEAHNRYIWMMDPEYFEQTARDRANQAKEGETVIRRPTPANRRQSIQEGVKN